MALVFDSAQLRDLGDLYTFYRYVDAEGKPLTGQFFAVENDQEPTQNGELFVFAAVVKVLNQPNSAVRLATLDSDFINKSIQERGAKAPGTVAKTHPALITFLLKEEARKASA